eukprot:XP_011454329.1 PREDICTED: uncharacterized protein LOC105347121 isoform X1 [Crassostrea gigas]
MSCAIPPSVPNGYPVTNIDDTGSQPKVRFTCNPGYVLSGGPNFYCNKTSHIWFGNTVCSPEKIPEVWFWLLIAVGSLVAIAVISALFVYCCKKCCWRNRVRNVGPINNEDYPPGCCGGCFDYGGSCDVCGCVDYYGCCSLFGCCGYRGLCGCGLFTCCRCCREPDDAHVQGNNVQDTRGRRQKRRTGILSKRTNMKARRKRRDLWRQWRSNRPNDPINDEVYNKVRRDAKMVAIWLPHSNPVRSINTSTK